MLGDSKMQHLQSDNNDATNNTKATTVFDLGSGDEKVILATALCYKEKHNNNHTLDHQSLPLNLTQNCSRTA
jgi:hypothetical protein